jgi:diguanylate cyclase (GGDEF)-like protein
VNLTGARESDGKILLDRMLPEGPALVLLVAMLAAIFVLDQRTELTPYQHLYYLPILLAGVRLGYGGGVGAALTAIVLYHLANPHVLSFRYEESDVVQIALFIAVGVTSATLARHSRQMHALAGTDDLTGLRNLRSFESGLRVLLRRARADRTSVGFVVIDLDRLKSLNDVHGHLAGAEAVRTVGRIIGERLTHGAIACRYGGDEFAVAIPHWGVLETKQFAEDLRDVVLGTAPVLAGLAFPAGTLSISAGVATANADADASPSADADSVEGVELFRRADSALYAAKAAGRNRVA